MPHIVFLQPRATGSPRVVGERVELPADAPPQATGAELSQPFCMAADRSQSLTFVGYDLAAVVAAAALFTLLKRRLLGSRTVRFLVAIAFGAGASAALGIVDPFRADDVARCVQSAEFARFVLFAHAAAPRLLALAAAPTAVCVALACFAVNRSY